MYVFGKVLALYGKLELAVAMITFISALVLVTALVIARQIGASLWWAQELAQLLVMYAYFLGVGHLYQVRQMVVVEFLVNRFPPSVQRIIYLVSQVAVIVFCLILIIAILKVYKPEIRFPSFVIQVPRFYWTLPLGIASVSMIASSTYFFLCALRSPYWTKGSGATEFEMHHAFASTSLDY